MRRSESEKFLKRAKGFYEDAMVDIEKGRFDLAAFHLEQTAQFLVKAKLMEIFGDFPKIHNINELLKILSKEGKLKNVKEFLNEKHRKVILAF
ncbi:MAG: HEPN domain-containing protein [Candidatus Aenigmatarchaeota archaeon]